MMRLWMMGACLATVVPLVALLAWIWPALSARWRQARLASRMGLVGLWLAGAGFLLCRPHEEVFTGLDVMAYRTMTHVFLEGRGFHDRDTVLEKVPTSLRRYLYFEPGPLGRPTRDVLFKLSEWERVDTSPFFLPMMPLAAGGLSPVLSPDRFMPLMGALWLALVLVAAFCAGGGWGILAGASLVMGTAWPAWFLRGFYPEGVGAILVSAVVAASAIRPPRGRLMLMVGFALGLSIGYHPTLAFLALPIGLGLAAAQGRWAETGRLAAGAVLGVLPLLAINRWVCQPYGIFLSWGKMRWLMSVAPEYRAVVVGLTLVATVGASVLAVCHARRVRDWLGTGWRRQGLTVSLAAAGVVACGVPCLLGGLFLTGWTAVWSGMSWSVAGLVVAGGVCVFALRRPMRERFWLAELCIVAIFFLYLKGVERPVGLWSQRRFLPVVLVGVSVLAAPLAAGLSVSAVWRRWAGGMLALLAAGAGLWNVVHWPAAFVTVDERGATKWARAVSDRLGTDRWVVFDYHPHSVPYAASLKQRVLGLNEASRDHWPEVAGWIASLVKTEEVWVATSWAPCALEDGFRLEEVFATTGSFPIVRTRMFLPAESGRCVIENHFMRAVPLVPGEKATQVKCFDGSPIALRGPWGRGGMAFTLPDGSRAPALWSREGSGVVGPVPPVGGSVRIVLKAASSQGTPQTLLIQPPWSTNAVSVVVPPDYTVTKVRIPRGESGRGERTFSSPTGVYRFHAKVPYDPAVEGIRGFNADLGALIHAVEIAVE